DINASAFPEPLRLDLGVQRTSGLPRHVREERFGQTFSGLAVGAGLCRAGALSLCQAMGDQAGDGGTAGMVGAEDLSQENPECEQGGKDPVQPAAERRQRLGQNLLGENAGERQAAVLEKLASQKSRLGVKGCRIRIAHAWGLLAGKGLVSKFHPRK